MFRRVLLLAFSVVIIWLPIRALATGSASVPVISSLTTQSYTLQTGQSWGPWTSAITTTRCLPGYNPVLLSSMLNVTNTDSRLYGMAYTYINNYGTGYRVDFRSEVGSSGNWSPQMTYWQFLCYR